MAEVKDPASWGIRAGVCHQHQPLGLLLKHPISKEEACALNRIREQDIR
jgi:hypothetical protein